VTNAPGKPERSILAARASASFLSLAWTKTLCTVFSEITVTVRPSFESRRAMSSAPDFVEKAPICTLQPEELLCAFCCEGAGFFAGETEVLSAAAFAAGTVLGGRAGRGLGRAFIFAGEAILAEGAVALVAVPPAASKDGEDGGNENSRARRSGDSSGTAKTSGTAGNGRAVFSAARAAGGTGAVEKTAAERLLAEIPPAGAEARSFA
jgi:hypothetical protein